MIVHASHVQQSVAVVTLPFCAIAMGKAVGTVTLIAVPAGVPPIEPSVVDERLTGVEPVPPFWSISAAKVAADITKHVHSAMRRAAILFDVFLNMCLKNEFLMDFRHSRTVMRITATL